MCCWPQRSKAGTDFGGALGLLPAELIILPAIDGARSIALSPQFALPQEVAASSSDTATTALRELALHTIYRSERRESRSRRFIRPDTVRSQKTRQPSPLALPRIRRMPALLATAYPFQDQAGGIDTRADRALKLWQ